MQNLKTIIFDVDGTLANTEETHRQSFNIAFQEFGLEYHWSVEDYTALLSISGGRERIQAFLKSQDFGIKSDLSLRNFALRLHKRKSEIYREKVVAGHIGLRSGVRRLIDEAHAGNIRLGIATATSLANVETLLKYNMGENALSEFDAIVTSDTVKDKKPSPVVYQFAVAELGLTPEYCVAIEDTSNGNRAALAAGLKTLITTHSFTKGNDFSGAGLVVDQLGEPDQPFHVLEGDAGKHNYVNLQLLDSLVDGAYRGDKEIPAEPATVCAK